MLCPRCERHLWTARLRRLWTSPAAVWGASRLSDLICARCGAVLAAELVTERLLDKLSQLGQVGLAAAAPPLLEPARGDV